MCFGLVNSTVEVNRRTTPISLPNNAVAMNVQSKRKRLSKQRSGRDQKSSDTCCRPNLNAWYQVSKRVHFINPPIYVYRVPRIEESRGVVGVEFSYGCVHCVENLHNWRHHPHGCRVPQKDQRRADCPRHASPAAWSRYA